MNPNNFQPQGGMNLSAMDGTPPQLGNTNAYSADFARSFLPPDLRQFQPLFQQGLNSNPIGQLLAFRLGGDVLPNIDAIIQAKQNALNRLPPPNVPYSPLPPSPAMPPWIGNR